MNIESDVLKELKIMPDKKYITQTEIVNKILKKRNITWKRIRKTEKNKRKQFFKINRNSNGTKTI